MVVVGGPRRAGQPSPHLVESEADEGHRGRAPEERPRRRGAARPAPPRRSAPQVWIPPAELREARELLRYRLSLVSIRTIVKNRLTALLARRNLQPHDGKRWTTGGGLRELQALALAPTPDTIRHYCLTALTLLDEQIRTLDRQLLDRWSLDPRVQRLTTIIPGVGPLIAIILVLELGNVQRFPSAKHLASYVGLTPRVRASGDRLRTGHISKEGNAILRWAAVVAATQAARRPGPLRLVPDGSAAARRENRPGGVGPAFGRDRLSHLEGGSGLLYRPAARRRAGVSPFVGMVFGRSLDWAALSTVRW